ncbi:hypothetical protein SO802_005386 [Lithocarpus litseifolius]|uniref:Acid phosphatase n=1 Tax=Lithocarpus litseifolius TaxID=425828 RepID=A0AAW2DI12_9ROSI
MLGYQYRKDVQAVADVAHNFAKSTPVHLDFRNTWIFGVADTVLSNLPYYAQPDIAFGQTSDAGTSSQIYKEKKRKELIAQGYRIIGNVGDQWSDLLGENVGYRTFKVPNPMFYIS